MFGKKKICELILKRYVGYGEHEGCYMQFPLTEGEYPFEDVFYDLSQPIEGVGDFSKVIVSHDLSILYGGKTLRLQKKEASASFPEMEEKGQQGLYVTINVKTK